MEHVTIHVSDHHGYNGYGDNDDTKGDILATCLCVGFFVFLIVIL